LSSAGEVLVARANAFPKDVRLRSAWEFQAVYEKGAKKVSRAFVVFMLPNGLTYSRFGMTTPRKLGKAHDRNRIRRRIREILRSSRELIPVGHDFVVNPRRASIDQAFLELRSELLTLLGVHI
jgi:ribonuclease P protein component